MELRSRRLGPSKEGGKPPNRESSDEDGERSTFSDSEYNTISDEGLGENRGLWDLNSVPEDGVQDDDCEGSASDSDVGNKVAKRGKLWVKKKSGGGSSCKRKWERVEFEDRVDGGGFRLQLEAHEIESDLLQFKKIKEKRKKKKEAKPILMWEVWEEEQGRWLKENSVDDVDIENQNEVAAETADAPSDLVMPLLRYQKEWLAWALKQEESTTRGGILADEMGMGKTVQAIALVLAKRELRRAICESNGFSSPPCSSTKIPEINCTLIICPLVAVLQWVSEIERFTSKGSNKVLVYHGAKRGKSLQHFSEYDFVITTYSIIEAEYRKHVMPPKQKCQWCGKLFYEHRMTVHLKYFCGPDAIRTDKQSKQQRKGKKILQNMLKHKSRSDEGHPSGPDGDGEKGLCKKTVKQSSKGKSLTIGSSKESAGVGQGLPNEKSILHSVKWERIILDEAHYIKDRRCNTTKAVLALESSYKWALSGTPLQNRVGEIYSLVRFLQIVPYSYYFCKDCDCRVLDYSSSTECPNCPHKSPRHFCWWNKYIATPIQLDGNIGSGRNAMILLKNKILKNIVLRRTKKGRAADLALPPRILRLRRDTMDVEEEDYYTSLYTESQAQFNTYIEAGTVMNNYAHIFDLLTRLRQAVDHPYLVAYSSSAAGRIGTVVDSGGSDEKTCGLCKELTEDPVVTSCSHTFCASCLINLSASAGQVLCPSCSKPLTVDFSVIDGDQNARTTIKGYKSSSILNRIPRDDFQTSTKIDALREEIRFMVERDGSAKGIVFSQFTSFLDLIQFSLEKSGISCVKLVGSMSMNARDAAIARFTDDSDCRIFLMSLKAGGVALNLTVASHVFLMDPWWNPAVERQAQDRIHRIGQYKPIRIVRFVIENTIEERILKLQEKKELVFEGTVGGSSEALGKLTEAELRFLFIT